MLSELCVRRPVFATMLVMSLVVLGIFSFRDLGVDLFPRADPATVNVSLSLPGASPDEISSSVIEPMEEAISGVSGIDEISARISPAVNSATRAFPFEALVPNEGALLKPGTFARVSVRTNKADKVLTLPYAALQYRYGVNRVFVVAGDKLAAKELKVGERLGDRIEIVSGVNAGDPVAMTDVDKLVDGQPVKTGEPGTKAK